LGVPNCAAHQPVRDCDWSRPVKKASFFGSVARMRASRCAAIAKLAGAARPGAQQRLAQPGRAQVLHDAGAALAADHSAVDRMIAVAGDVADLPVLDVDIDAAPAGAHVAGGLADLVADHGRGFDAVALRRCAGIGQGTLGRCRVGGARAHGARELSLSVLPELFLGPGPRM
jgi:hypothetical protein